MTNDIANLLEEDHPLLREDTSPWDFDKEYDFTPEKFSKLLIDTMNANQGLGLSANQIGVPLSVFCVKHEENDICMFNPTIINTSEERVLLKEGCLSYPGLFIKIVRPQGVTVQYKDHEGNMTFGSFIDMTARAVLHEYDHLRGVVYTDLAKKFHPEQAKNKRKILMRKVRRMK